MDNKTSQLLIHSHYNIMVYSPIVVVQKITNASYGCTYLFFRDCLITTRFYRYEQRKHENNY